MSTSDLPYCLTWNSGTIASPTSYFFGKRPVDVTGVGQKRFKSSVSLNISAKPVVFRYHVASSHEAGAHRKSPTVQRFISLIAYLCRFLVFLQQLARSKCTAPSWAFQHCWGGML